MCYCIQLICLLAVYRFCNELYVPNYFLNIPENGVTEPCHAQLEFRVYLVSAATGSHTREARALRFWFKPQLPPNERSHEAQAFFRELVSPQDFPKG